MQTIIITEGITLTATQSTIDAYKAELAAIEAERREAQQLYELWQVLQTMERSDPLYSDLYKDVYGVRPRW